VPDPLVSVVITTHNRKEMLRRAVGSVLDQTFTDFEIIIVDDHSTDGTSPESIGHDDSRIRYVRNEECRGANYSRNVGINASRGEFVCILDDDDEWLPSKLEKQVSKIQGGPDSIGLVYSGFYYVTEDGSIAVEAKPQYRGDVKKALIERCIFGALTVMVRKEAIIKAGLYDERMRSCQDWDMWIRVSELCEVDFIDEPLAKYHVHSGQISTDLGKKIDGRLHLYDKYRTAIESTPGAEGKHLMCIGILYIHENDRRKGISYLVRSIASNPFQFRPYMHLVMNLFFPTLHSKFLKKQAAVGNSYLFT